MTDVVQRECQAKVNLLLRVLAREASGMHGLETVFCRIALADSLVAERTASGISLDVEGAELGPPEQNLAWRAADAVLAATGRRFGVRLLLTKRIPVGAGLGGGSSDAAATLAAVNQLAGDAVPRAELLHAAARLGADVPFLLSDAPLALAWGHGTRMLALPPLPIRPMVLLLPPLAVATAEAYAWLDRQQGEESPRVSVLLDPGVLGNWGDLARLGGNDFEAPVFARHPELRAAFGALAATQPLLCRMTGSGSALFAVYRSEADRDAAVGQLGSRHGRVVATSNR
jgi:4-diphosphocytidyl-2-C-methyl-D-erythritol kinase